MGNPSWAAQLCDHAPGRRGRHGCSRHTAPPIRAPPFDRRWYSRLVSRRLICGAVHHLAAVREQAGHELRATGRATGVVRMWLPLQSRVDACRQAAGAAAAATPTRCDHSQFPRGGRRCGFSAWSAPPAAWSLPASPPPAARRRTRARAELARRPCWSNPRSGRPKHSRSSWYARWRAARWAGSCGGVPGPCVQPQTHQDNAVLALDTKRRAVGVTRTVSEHQGLC